MGHRGERGQAAAEYVGVVCVVAVCLAVLAGLGVAAPGLPRAVMDRFEHALCVVGLDVCESADARAQALPPCVTSSEDRTRGTALTIAVVDTGGTDRLVVQARSDGSYVVTAIRGDDVGASAGVGLQLGPLVDVEATVGGGVGFTSGTSVDVPDAAALRRLLGNAARDPGAARKLVRRIDEDWPAARVERYRELGGRLGVDASASLGVQGTDGKEGSYELGGAGGETRAAVGSRVRDGVQTLFYDVASTVDGPLTDVLPSDHGRLSAAWTRSDPPVLTLTTSSRSSGRDTVVEARMVLSDPADRALAKRWVLSPARLGDGAGRALARRLGDAPTVQRFVYLESSADEGSYAFSGKLGVGLGIDHQAQVVRRTLVDAQVLGRPFGGRRLDCLVSR